jgi:hypothetical protein
VRNSLKQLVWACAACAAVIAQATPKVFCQACDQPCCVLRADELAAGCPLCAAAGLRQAESDEEPCHCQLNARHEQPLSLSRGSVTAAADDSLAVWLPAAQQDAPHALGVSREYLAASLAMPIRPPRILFGVWRN